MPRLLGTIAAVLLATSAATAQDDLPHFGDQNRLAELLDSSDPLIDDMLNNFNIVFFVQDTELRYQWVSNPTHEEQAVLGQTDHDLFVDKPKIANRLSTLKRAVMEQMEGRRAVIYTTYNNLDAYWLTICYPWVEDDILAGVRCVAQDLIQMDALGSPPVHHP